MSHGKESNDARLSDQWASGHARLIRMISEGRSWSGKERHCAFLNTGSDPAAGGRFASVASVSGIDFPDDGRGLAVVDWDHDGDLDLWLSNRSAPRIRLLRNNGTGANRALMLRLVGNGTTTNRDAIGARVEVTVREKGEERGEKEEEGGADAGSNRASRLPLVKTLRAGEGFVSQSSKWVHIGLGTAEGIEMVTVRWPGGAAETFTGLKPGGRYTLVQGSGESSLHAPRTEILNIAAGQQQRLPVTDQATIRLAQPMQLPDWKWAGYGGPDAAVATAQGKPVLINVWASWCPNCVGELKDLAKRQSELEDAGIEVVAVCTNGLGENTTDMKQAVKLLYSIDFPFCATRLDPKLYELLKAVQQSFIPFAGPLPLPCSFLLDGKGRLAAIYRGPVSVDDLIRDAQFPEEDWRKQFEWSAILPGSALEIPSDSDPARSAAVNHHFAVGKLLQVAGYSSTAVEHYRRILEMSRGTHAVHNNLGAIYLTFDRVDEAVEHFRTAIELDPDQAPAHQNLGIAYHRTKKQSLAESEYKLALGADPNLPDAHRLLGDLYLEIGNIEESIAYLQRAIELAPDRPAGYHSLAAVYLDQDEPAKAIELLEKALEVDPDHQEVKKRLRQAKVMLNK